VDGLVPVQPFVVIVQTFVVECNPLLSSAAPLLLQCSPFVCHRAALLLSFRSEAEESAVVVEVAVVVAFLLSSPKGSAVDRYRRRF
jgi:hypothetical protein